MMRRTPAARGREAQTILVVSRVDEPHSFSEQGCRSIRTVNNLETIVLGRAAPNAKGRLVANYLQADLANRELLKRGYDAVKRWILFGGHPLKLERYRED